MVRLEGFPAEYREPWGHILAFKEQQPLRVDMCFY